MDMDEIGRKGKAMLDELMKIKTEDDLDAHLEKWKEFGLSEEWRVWRMENKEAYEKIYTPAYAYYLKYVYPLIKKK